MMPRKSQQTGFTLVELMVAITGGLFMSIVVFALARQGTRFYQQEIRAANASDPARIGEIVTRVAKQYGCEVFMDQVPALVEKYHLH